MFIQEKVIGMRISFKKPHIYESRPLVARQENKIDLLRSTVKFLIAMVQGNNDKSNLMYVIKHIDCEKMMRFLHKIYTERLKDIQRSLVLELVCPGGKKSRFHSNCNQSVCEKGMCTAYDRILNEIGFSIFTLFSYLAAPQDASSNATDPSDFELFRRMYDQKHSFSILDFAEENRRRHKYFQTFKRRAKKQARLAEKVRGEGLLPLTTVSLGTEE